MTTPRARSIEFQRNVGITADGICGPETIAALDRLNRPPLEGLAEGEVASVREREALRRGEHKLSGKRVFVAATPGFETLGTGIVHGLLAAGADAVLDTTGGDGSEIASEANRYSADLFLAVGPGDAPGCRCSYFESGRFRSEAGYRVATAIREELEPLLGERGRRVRPRLRRAPRDQDGGGDLRAGGRRRRRRRAPRRHARARAGPGDRAKACSAASAATKPDRTVALAAFLRVQLVLGAALDDHPVDALEVLEGRELHHDLAA